MEELFEQLQRAAADTVTDPAELIRQLDAADLDAGGKEWIKSLFDRILSPVTDTLARTEEGVDTELIRPAEQAEVSDSAAEYRIKEAVENWHMQNGDNSCAVCSQQFIINEFTGLDVTEEQLCEIAEAQGWFDAAQGTAPKDIGNLLELFGIDTQVNYEGDIRTLQNTLDQGGRAIVAVDSMVLWVDGFENYPAYGADHAIEVIDIDASDPLDVKIIINDSGIEGGGGRSVPYLDFMEAWLPSGGFMVSAFPKV